MVIKILKDDYIVADKGVLKNSVSPIRLIFSALLE